MDLREKLKQFETNFRPKPASPYRSTSADVDLCVAGEEVSNALGAFFRSVTIYPEDHRHGCVSMDLVKEVDPQVLGLVGKDEALMGKDLRKAVFLDTETTGLAGGVGTVPFMIGLGYFHDDGFRVDQFFMRDYDEEQAVLFAIKERLEQSEALVSYNGKAYDLNILASRFTLSRMENPCLDIPHLDLLFTARRLWRRRISDCSLSNIERSILDFHRIDDIPGFLIPGLYFDYLRSRAGKLMEPVFRHNRWDIITLVTLAAKTGKIFQYPEKYLSHPLDWFSLGRALENSGLYEEASNAFEEALNYSMEPDYREEVLRNLGFSLKRLGDWEKAVKIWELMIKTTSQRMMAYEELAKYYEHRTGEIERAIEIVKRGLEWIQFTGALRPFRDLKGDQKDLLYRLARLNRKKKMIH